MRKLLLAACITVALFSCKKEKHTTEQAKKYSLNFNVSGFTQSSEPYEIKKTHNADSIASYADKLIFMLFDEDGKLLSQKVHQTDAEDFENFNESAPPGNYTVVFVACHQSAEIELDSKGWPVDSYELVTDGPWKDAFYKRVNITVNNSEINENVSLNRIVAQLQLRILDPIPAEITRIELTWQDSTAYRMLPNVVGRKEEFLAKVSNMVPTGSLNYTITAYTRNSSLALTINCYNNDNRLVFTRTVNNVKCVPNKRTVISGNLFTGNQNFVIDVNDVWGPPIDHPF